MRKKIVWVCSSCGTPYGEGKNAWSSWRGGDDQYAAHKCPGSDPHVGHHDVMTELEWKQYNSLKQCEAVLRIVIQNAESATPGTEEWIVLTSLAALAHEALRTKPL